MAPPKLVSSLLEFVEWVEQVADLFTASDLYEAPWFRE
jgi:hypothetical protein